MHVPGMLSSRQVNCEHKVTIVLTMMIINDCCYSDFIGLSSSSEILYGVENSERDQKGTLLSGIKSHLKCWLFLTEFKAVLGVQDCVYYTVARLLGVNNLQMALPRRKAGVISF